MKLAITVFFGFLLVCFTAASASDTAAGRVETVTGKANATRAEQSVVALSAGDKIFKDDILQTGADGSLGIVLQDNTEISLGPNSRIAIDDFVLAPEAGNLSLLTQMTKGTSAFVSGKIADLSKDSVKFETPLGTIGIRGTKFLVKLYAVQRNDNFLVLFDASASMNEYHNGVKKFDLAKDLVKRITHEIPNLKYQVIPSLEGKEVDDLEFRGGARVFFYDLDKNYTSMIHQMSKFSADDINAALEDLKRAVGYSSIERGLRAAADDLKNLPGNTAIIVISDGRFKTKGAIKAARSIKSEFGGKLCLYPVLMGDDPEGRENMAQLAEAGKCGFLAEGDHIASAGEIGDFTGRVFLCDEFSVGKGDSREIVKRCRAPQKGTIVLLPDVSGKVGAISVSTAKGSQIVDKASHATVFEGEDEVPREPVAVADETITNLFDEALAAVPEPLGRFTIFYDSKSTRMTGDSQKVFKDIVEKAKYRKETFILVEGHADSKGSKEFNFSLSRQRAEGVRQLLASAGIDTGIIDFTYYGEESLAVKTADDVEESKNRRVEITVW